MLDSRKQKHNNTEKLIILKKQGAEWTWHVINLALYLSLERLLTLIN